MIETVVLIRCNLVIQVGDTIWVNIGSDIGMVPSANNVNFKTIRSNDMRATSLQIPQSSLTNSPGAKMGTWKCLRVQGFMIDPESIGVLKEIKLGCHDGNPGELFLFA